MDWIEPVIIAALGALFGASFTAVATWRVSIGLDRQRERRSLDAAMAIVASELRDNHARMTSTRGSPPDISHVTLGDWANNKTALAALGLRDKELWERLGRTYTEMYEFREGRGRPPDAERLSCLATELEGERRGLRREVRGFSRLPRLGRKE